ncbi:hypothetical protein, partial [Lactobacillus crispatus]|uniref:hypothetical protein n=2 Tax=Lactobacillus crispatus TaxID=47770 RepID=UPI001C60CA7D
FFVQTNHTRKELLFLMFKEINLRNHSSLHKLFYSLIIPPEVLAKELTVSQNDLGNFQLASLYSMFSFSDGVLKLPVCVIALKFKKSI